MVWLLLILGVVLLLIVASSYTGKVSNISYGMFLEQLQKKNIEKAEVQGSQVIGEFKDRPKDKDDKGKEITLEKKFTANISPLVDAKKVDDLLYSQLGREYTVKEPSDNTILVLLLYLGMFVALFAGLWFMFRKARESIFSGGIMGGFSKSGARRSHAG